MELFILIVTLVILTETTFLVAKKYKPSKSNGRKIYVDTSVLIDGRIVNIAKTGFVDGNLIILKSVLRELQLLADSKENDKRNRARLGLEAVSELERVVNINTEIFDDGEGYKKVDDELLKYAKQNNGVVLTIDYNLIMVAEAEKIEVLNVNDLALAVKVDFVPGEKLKIQIVEKGSGKGQGIGHMPDGTMVVVDKAAGKIGEEVNIELLRIHETSSGKMIFAKIAN